MQKHLRYFSIFSVRELATFFFKHLNDPTFKFNFQAQQLFNERNKIKLSGTNKGIDNVSCVVTFQLDSCSGHIIFQVIYSLVSGSRRGKEELTVTVNLMAKLRVDQKCNGDDLSKTLSRGLSPYLSNWYRGDDYTEFYIIFHGS